MANPFQRYRPIGALPVGSPPFIDNSAPLLDQSLAAPDDYGDAAIDDGPSYAPDTTGPAAQIQQMPANPEPSARQDAMDAGAGSQKAPPPLAGAPPVPTAQNIDNGTNPNPANPAPATDPSTMISAARAKYPFISSNVVIIPKKGGAFGSEGWPAGEAGSPDYPRPKEIPLNSPGIEFDTKGSADDLAGEVLHTDKFANDIRDQMAKSLSPDQIKYLSHESLDYGAGTNTPDDVKLRNGTDALIRGALLGQWPAKAVQGMNLTADQQKLLGSLKQYMVTGQQPGTASPPAVAPSPTPGQVGAPPAMSGAPSALASTPNPDDETNANPDAGTPLPPLSGMNGAPPAMAGAPAAPKSVQDAALAKYAALAPPPLPKQNLAQKIGQIALGVTRMGPQGAAEIMHPNYMQQVGAYQAQKADLANQVNLADKAEDISSKAESRIENASTREQNALTATAKNGIIIVPAGQQPPPGFSVPTINPLSDNQKYANSTAWRDPNFGKFQVTKSQADLSNGALAEGQWLPLSDMSELMKAGVAQGKPAKADLVMVSASTAKDLGVTNQPDANGMVSVPTSLLSKKIEADNKQPKANDTKTQVGLRRLGLPADTDLNTLTADQATKLAQFGREDAAQFKVSTGNEGTWSIQEDADGKPIQYNSKTGETRPMQGGVQKSGTKAKADAAQEKVAASARDAMTYANDYLANKQFTGPGDEALQEKFFELSKPSTGFRMNQQVMVMLKNSQNWKNSVAAHIRHATTGTWFSDEQRQQIVDTMNNLANSKLKAAAGGAGAAPPAAKTAQSPSAKPQNAADYLKSIGH